MLAPGTPETGPGQARLLPCGKPMAAIRTHNLRKAFQSFVAVEDLDLEIPYRTAFAMLGPNGAGKSTLIRMLTTLLIPTSGKAFVGGHDIATAANDVRRSIGVIPQAFTSDPDLTAEENLVFYGRLFGISGRECRRMVDGLLDQVQLRQWRKKMVRTFSGGMRRRLEIARSLMHRPKILFLDEPTTGLDPASRAAMWEMIRRLKDETNLTIFLTTHYMEEADQLCDHIGIFDHGRLVALDTPGNLKAKSGAARRVHTAFGLYPPEWIDTIRRLPAVLGVRPLKEACEIESSDSMTTVAALIEAAQSRGVVITSLVVSGGTLEDVFVEYTGRDLRDSAKDSAALDVSHLYAGR
jgi:ABC-2 type transport system ATP-binding protein